MNLVWLKNKQWIDDKGYEFKPFGESLGTESDASKGWVGLDNDYENGYKQLGYRTYDPNTGRFLQVDPLFEKYPNLSPYNYCDNRPMVLKDPLGLSMLHEAYVKEKEWSFTICGETWEDNHQKFLYESRLYSHYLNLKFKKLIKSDVSFVEWSFKLELVNRFGAGGGKSKKAPAPAEKKEEPKTGKKGEGDNGTKAERQKNANKKKQIEKIEEAKDDYSVAANVYVGADFVKLFGVGYSFGTTAIIYGSHQFSFGFFNGGAFKFGLGIGVSINFSLSFHNDYYATLYDFHGDSFTRNFSLFTPGVVGEYTTSYNCWTIGAGVSKGVGFSASWGESGTQLWWFYDPK